jgi:rod shape-determining protein MreD
MVRKTIISVLFLFFLAVFQTSFLIRFSFFGIVLNLVIIAVFLVNLLEKKENKLGVICAFLGGFFLDIFSLSGFFFGFYVLVCLIISFFIKFVFKRYVQTPTLKEI